MTWLRRSLALAAATFSLLTAAAQPAQAVGPPKPVGSPHHDHIRDTATSAQPASTTPLIYNGGSILTAPAVYLSFWGGEWNSGWSSGGYSSSQAESYLEGFFNAVGGSGWENVATQYCQGIASGATTCPATASFVGDPAVQYLGAWVDPYPVPSSPADADIGSAAARAEAHFGYRPGAVYFVMTPTGKSESGFGINWCAWHSSETVNGVSIPYAYLPYMPDAGSSCGVNSVNSNDSSGHGYFDGFSIVGGHEYLEAATDPFPNGGWVDSSGQENSDKCQWGGRQTNFTFPNGAYYAVQPTWSNAIAGCQLSAAVTAPAPAPTPTPTPTPTPAPPPPATFTSYFSWYDNVSAGMRSDNIHVVNPGTAAVTGSISVGGSSVGFAIPAGAEGYYAFPGGTMGGPVVLNASARVIASQRVQYYSSFNEVAARTASDAAGDIWFPWFDKASPGMASDNVHLVNPTGSTISGTVTLGAASAPVASATFSLGAGGTTYVSFPSGTIGGPIHVHANSGAVLASQRVQYYSTFNEAAGQASSVGAPTLYFNWFDLASPGMVNDNIHIVNPGGSPVTGSVTLGSTGAIRSFSVPAYGGTFVSFGAGVIGGPVIVRAGGPVLATQRVQYYGSFNEAPGRPGTAAATTSYMPWYDLASPGMVNDNVHLLNPSGSPVSGTVAIAGGPSVGFTVPAGGEWFGNLGVTMGGPVVVSVAGGGAVLASQRVQYGQSFNEAAASS